MDNKVVADKVRFFKKCVIELSDFLKLNEKKFFLCHEPIQDTIAEFYLFGHIHRLQMVKRNSINVGVDANRFNPMSVKELEFLYGGVTKHYDENVFIDTCGPVKVK